MHPDNSLSLEQSIAWHRAEIARLMATTIGRRPAARIKELRSMLAVLEGMLGFEAGMAKSEVCQVTASRRDAIASLRAELSRWEEATAAWTDSDRKRSDAEIADLRRRIANIEAVGPEELRRRIDAIPPVRP
jgi:hypothetical protein